MRRPRIALTVAILGFVPVLATPLRADVSPIRFADRAVLPSIGKVQALSEMDGVAGLDIIGAEGSEVRILRNQGARTFSAPVLVPFGGALQGIQVLDFDRDGAMDLAAIRTSPPALVIRRNLGALAFGPHIEFALPADPRVVVRTDLDGNGWPDLLVPCRDSLVAFLSMGPGFLTPVVTPMSPMNSHVLGTATGDLDADQIPDVALYLAAHPNGAIQWRHGNGDGTFAGVILLAPTAPVEGLEIADLDLDGKADLVAGRHDGIFWHRNLGSGSFADAAHLDEPPATEFDGPTIAVADLDRDGIPDVLGYQGNSYSFSSAVRVIRGSATSGSAPSPAWYVESRPHSLVVGDLDGDGHLDTAVGSPYMTAVLWNDTRGRLMGKLLVPIGPSSGPGGTFGIVVSRSAPHAAPDLVATHEGEIRLVRNAGNGTFYGAEVVGLGTVVSAADLDHDGDEDLILGSPDSALVLPRLGAGGFGSPIATYIGLRPLGLADFDGNGELDLALASSTGALSIRFGDGAGGFGAAREAGIVLSIPEASWFTDLDGDGDADAAWAGPVIISGGPSTYRRQVPLHVARNDGQGNLTECDVDTIETTAVGGANYAGRVRSGDVDGDGDLDLVLLVGGPGSVAVAWWGVFLNAGDGTFTTSGTSRSGGSAGGVLEVADMNRDGLDDVVIHECDGLDPDFHAVAALGGGAFGPFDSFDGQPSASRMVVADLDLDGRMDAAILSSYYDRITVMRNISADVPTPALVSCVSARFRDGSVELEWFSPDAGAFSAMVERSAGNSGTWSEVGDLVAIAGLVRWRDPDVRAGERYGYRLRYQDGRVTRRTAETWVDVPVRPARIALRIAGPNPSAGSPMFDLVMPGAGEATLEIFDLGGRRLAIRRVMSMAGGIERITFAGVGLPPGLHLARARLGTSEAVTRFVIVR